MDGAPAADKPGPMAVDPLTEDPIPDSLPPAAAVALASGRVRLRIVHPEDYPFLYELSLAPELRFRWRFRNEQPPYADFIRSLGVGVFCQYIVVDAVSNVRLGLVVCYQANRLNRNAYIGVQSIPSAHRRGLIVEASQLFIEHLFTYFDFEKLYAECLDFNVAAFRSGTGDAFVEEGRLRDHERFMGRLWDLHIFALYKEAWKVRHEGVLGRATTALAENGLSVSGSGLSFEAFAEVITRAMELEGSTLSAETKFVEDLAFDSVQMFELLIVVEEMGTLIPDSALGEIRTFGDLHFHYLQGRRTSVAP